jgi:hypothetical protein
MGSSRAAGSAVAVAIVPSSGLGSGLRAMFEQWTAASAVGASYWLEPSGVMGTPAVPRFSATYVSREGSRVVDLMTDLASQEISLIRLIAIVPVGAGAAEPQPALEAFERLSETVSNSLPVNAARAELEISMVAVKLVVPTGDAVDAEIEEASAGWATTLVVAPEDRPTPDSLGTSVWADTNWTPHAAAAFASVAGLWPGVSEGVAEALSERVGSAMPGTVRVIRTYARTATSPDGTRGLLDEAVRWAAGSARLPVRADSGLTPSLRDDTLVADARTFVRQQVTGDLGLQPYARDASPEKRRTGLDAFRQLARFAGWCVALLVRVTADAVVDSAGRGATKITFGTEGTTNVTFRPASSSILERAAEEQLRGVSLSNAELIRGAEGARQAVPVPATWRLLRATVFGLVDGSARESRATSATPDAVEVVSDRSRAVVPTVEAVDVPTDLRGVLTRYEGTPRISPHDHANARALLASCDEVRTYLVKRKEREAREENDALNPADEGDGDGHPLSWDEVEIDRTLRSLEDLDHAVRGILTASSTSLAGQIVKECGDGLIEAQRGLRALRSITEARTAFSAKRVTKARRRYLVGTYVTLAIVGYVLVAWQLGLWPFTAEWVAARPGNVVVAVALVGAALILLLIQAYFRAQSRFQRELNVACYAAREAARECAHLVREASRLEDVYTQLVDWVEVMSRVVHHPYSEPEPPDGPVETSPPVVHLPLATQIITVEPRDPSAREVATVAHLAVHQGWALEAFYRLAAYAFADLDASGEEGVRLADSDVPSAPNQAREYLRDALRSGAPQAAHTEWLRDRAALALEEARGEELAATGASPLSSLESRFLEAIGGSATQFARDAWTATALVEGIRSPEQCVLWAPAGLKLSPDLEVRAIERNVAAGRVTTSAVRCDYSVPVEAHELRFVLRQEAPIPPPSGRNDADF